MKTREEEIKTEAQRIFLYEIGSYEYNAGFRAGAKWADEHPQNPWRDAKKELPKDKCKVLVLYGDECEVVHFKNGEFICIATDQQKYLGEAMVMEDGELVEKPIFSVPQREHITDIVTHWMPIPETPEGGEK